MQMPARRLFYLRSHTQQARRGWNPLSPLMEPMLCPRFSIKHRFPSLLLSFLGFLLHIVQR
jgi:hypothetical protein